MTPSTINRLARLYERVVGYHPFEGGDWTPVEALDGLRWFRTALILCNDDPTAYTGPILTKAQLVAGQAAYFERVTA